MPATDRPILSADDEGVWEQGHTGRKSGIVWHDIHIVSGSKLDCMTRIVTVVTLDWDNGEFFELMDDWPGFDDVVQQLSRRLPGIAPDWITQVRSLSVKDGSIEVWKRA